MRCQPQACPVTGCLNRSRYCTGLCSAHAERLRRTGSLDRHTPIRTPGRDDVGYRAAHRRVERAKGRATQHTCPCGQPAREWAYVSSIDERSAPVNVGNGKHITLRYSTNPDDYLPLCLSCHRSVDAERACERRR